MTENDYIAEYIKERHPGDLSFDFAVWKLARKMTEVAKEIAQVFSERDLSEMQDSEDQDSEGKE